MKIDENRHAVKVFKCCLFVSSILLKRFSCYLCKKYISSNSLFLFKSNIIFYCTHVLLFFQTENKRRTPSAKKSRLTTSGKRPGSTKSGASFQTQSPPLSQPEKEYDFTGYNLGDNLLSVSGDLSYLFPQNKSLIKIERFQYVQANTSVMVSVMKRGDLFTVNFVNPLFTENEDKEGDVIQEVVKSNLTMETSENGKLN